MLFKLPIDYNDKQNNNFMHIGTYNTFILIYCF